MNSLPRATVLLFVVIVMMFTQASAHDICPFDRNPGLYGASYEKIYALAATVPQKDQFETKPQYEARVEQTLARLFESNRRAQQNYGGLVAVKRLESQVGYDADREIISIKTHGTIGSDPFDLAWNEFDDLVLGIRYSDTTERLGTAEGQNAFGVHATISVWSEFERDYAFVPSTLNGSSIHLPRTITIHASPREARAIVSNLELAVAGRIVPPYTSHREYKSDATISSPNETQENSFSIYMHPVCAVFRDASTHRVYFRWIGR